MAIVGAVNGRLSFGEPSAARLEISNDLRAVLFAVIVFVKAPLQSTSDALTRSRLEFQLRHTVDLTIAVHVFHLCVESRRAEWG